jgi:hypothetical protein
MEMGGNHHAHPVEVLREKVPVVVVRGRGILAGDLVSATRVHIANTDKVNTRKL